jgi:hypothetical protein
MGRKTKPGASWIRPVELNCRSQKVPLSRGIVKEKLRAKTTFTNSRLKHICHCGFRIAECGFERRNRKVSRRNEFFSGLCSSIGLRTRLQCRLDEMYQIENPQSAIDNPQLYDIGFETIFLYDVGANKIQLEGLPCLQLEPSWRFFLSCY